MRSGIGTARHVVPRSTRHGDRGVDLGRAGQRHLGLQHSGGGVVVLVDATRVARRPLTVTDRRGRAPRAPRPARWRRPRRAPSAGAAPRPRRLATIGGV